MSFLGPIQTIGTLALFLVCGFAMWRGGGAERLAAGLIFADWCFTPVLQNHDGFHHMQIAIFTLDGVLAFALLVIALRTDRYWPLWVVAFQVLELFMHMAMLTDHNIKARGYWVGMEIASYLMLAALATGTWIESPRRSGKRWPSRDEA